MSWGIGLVMVVGFMATPAAFAQAPATPGTPEPPTVEVPQPPEPPEVNPPEPPEVNPPEPPDVEVPEPQKPGHVDPPKPPHAGVPDPPKGEKPDKPKRDKPKGDEDAQPEDDNEAPPVATATAKPTQTQAAKPRMTRSKPAARVHVDAKPKRLTAAPVIRSKPASSAPRSVPTVAAVHVASATVVSPTSRTVSDPINAAPDPRPVAAHAAAVTARASPPQPRAVTLNGSRERIEITLAFALLFPALVAFMIGRALARGADTKDRYHL